MTPKEKAENLVKSFDRIYSLPTVDAKLCAIICVNEIMNQPQNIYWQTDDDYWQQVKEELENL